MQWRRKSSGSESGWFVQSFWLTPFFLISARVGCEPHSYPKNGNSVNGFRAASAWDKGRVGGRCVSSNACVTHSVLRSDCTDLYIDLVGNIGFEGSKGGSKIPPCYLGGWGGGYWLSYTIGQIAAKSDIKGPLCHFKGSLYNCFHATEMWDLWVVKHFFASFSLLNICI
jgi:hypothetical protein